MKNGAKKILIVDDDKFLLDMYSVKFTEAGFEVDTAFGATEALEKLARGFSPSALLLDIVMPEMSGLELLGKIYNQKLAPNAAIIVLSNQGQPGDIEEAKKIGVDGYIIKASTIPSEVLDQVEDIIKRKNA